MERWLIYALGALFLWGLWGVVLKLAERSLNGWFNVYVASNTAVIIGVVVVAVAYRNTLTLPSKGALTALIAGALGTLGYAFLVFSLEAGGPTAIVIPLTALYPVITAILAVFILGEKLTPIQYLGVALAVAAVILISTQQGGTG